MIKPKIFTFLILILIATQARSQDFLGINTGNFAGVTGLSLQPASIVDSRYKFDINLFSTGINYSNNYLLVNREAILKFNKNNYENYNSFKQRYLTESNLAPGEKVFFNLGNRVQLPLSFMATTGKKSAIAFNMQFRSVIQGRGISTDLAKLAYNDFYFPPLNNSSIDASGTAVNALNWASAGLTYGRVLYSSDNHFLKAAFTAKYLAGVASVNFSSANLNLQVNTDSTFNFTTSSFNYNHNKNADYDIAFDKKYRPDAEAFGFDAGLVYEYRGNLKNFRYIRNDDERSYTEDRRDLNKYIFKLGVSILDAGRFTFNKPANVNSFSANINNWDLKNANYGSLDEFDTALASRVTANANDPRKYSVYLPTALSVQADIRFVKGLFLNMMSYQPLKLGNSDGIRFNNYGYYAITPRYERRHFGIYVPYSIAKRNEFSGDKDNALGITLRAGPFFIGSSNLGTMAFKKQLRSADVHLGLKVGITYGKPNKANRLLEKTFSKKESDAAPVPEEMVKAPDKKTTETGRLLMNYKDGNIYENTKPSGNIIIINNYYYGLEKGKADTIRLNNEVSRALRDNKVLVSRLSDSISRKVLDSISINTADSLQQKRKKMDSLIRSLQQLQHKMDSNMNTAAAKDNSSKARIKQLAIEDYNKSNNRDTVFLRANKSQQQLSSSDSVMATGRQVKATDTVYVNKKRPASGDTKKTTDRRPVSSDTLITKERRAAVNDTVKLFNQRPVPQDTVKVGSKRPQQQANNRVNYSRDSYDPADSRLQAEETKRRQNYEALQQDMNRQYEQYASQADALSKDIERLNERLADSRRYKQSSTNYVPVNTNREPYVVKAPANISVEKTRDTIYIKDTVYVTKTTLASVDKEVKKKEPIVVTLKPGFDYTSLPAEIVLFATSSATLQPIYHDRLAYVAKILVADSTLAVAVTGHTDSSGSRQINEKLSRLRAETVAAYLKVNGVMPAQVRLQAFASTEPAVPGTNSAADRQNRRVEVKLLKASK